MSRLARSLLCALLASVCFERASALQVVEPASVENFDIRLNADRAPAGYLRRVGADRPSSLSAARADERAQGLARLRRDYNGIDIVRSPALGTPEVVARARGLSRRSVGAEADAAPKKGDRAGTLRSFLSGYADAYGLSAPDVASLDLAADYANPSGNMAWVELTQRVNGVRVFQGAIRGAFTASGELVATSGVLATGVDARALRSVAAVTAAQALVMAAGSVGWDLDERELVEQARDAAGRITFAGVGAVHSMRAWPVYFPLAPGLLRLAWATELLGNPMGYLTLVDAEDGSLLFRKGLTEFQSQAATYAIYAGESPAPWSPTTATPGSGAQAPPTGRTLVTLVGNEAPNTFNADGWMPDGTNATDGSNVQAGVDLTLPDGIDQFTMGAGVNNRVFNFQYDPAPGSDVPTSTDYRNGEVTNVFYWSNVYHDRLYRLGFTEAAGNFQKKNFGRGGAGGDPIVARVQHFGQINNATFAATPDGTPGHMHLFVFTGPNPDRPSGLDRGVILHELTHGLSNRLHGNATGLSRNMARGMGEGWSDFYAQALVATADEDVDGVYSFGGWITHQLARPTFTDNHYYGIRRFPYAVKTSVGPNGRPHNPLTLADADLSQFDISDGAYPPSPNAGGSVDEVHNLGEIWAMALFEVRARFITRLGFDEGNERILQFVTDGMKLDPLNPTFLQGRDAILDAARAGGGTAADIADIWAGFAARGMGVSARILEEGTSPTTFWASAGANDTRVIEAFDEPGLSATTATLVSDSIPNGRLDPGETIGVSLCVANNLNSASGPVTATLLTGGGVVSPSGAQSYGAVSGNGSACRTFTFTVDAACGATVTASVLAIEQGGVTRTLTYALPVGSLVPSFAETFDDVTAPALPAGWSTSTLNGTANVWATSATAADAGRNRVFASNLASVSDSVLVSPPIALPAGANLLTFRHRYDTQWRFDGGLLEIAIGGGAFDDLLRAGGTFVRAGYSGQLQSEPMLGARAWSGFSQRYMTTIAELPASASGESIRLRWRMASNGSVAGDNWSVDSVSIGQIACSQPTSPPPVDPPPVDPPPGPPPPPPPPPVEPPPVVPGPPPPPEPGTTVQPPASLYASSIAGDVVTLRWTQPAHGPAPTDYVLEGGVLPGQVLASLPVGHVAPAFTFTAPPGAFHLRLRALAGANRSVASNEIRVFVNAPTPPSPPSNLTGLVNGDTITLAWRNTFGGGVPTSMALDVAGSINGSFPLGLSEGFSLPGVPAGTYTLAIRAVNNAGSSAPSNAITLAFPGGCTGVPEPPANFLAYNIGHLVRVLWDAPASGAAPSSYVLHVGGAVAGSVPLKGDGITAMAGAGTYHLSLQGMNACGASGVTPAQTIIVP